MLAVGIAFWFPFHAHVHQVGEGWTLARKLLCLRSLCRCFQGRIEYRPCDLVIWNGQADAHGTPYRTARPKIPPFTMMRSPPAIPTNRKGR